MDAMASLPLWLFPVDLEKLILVGKRPFVDPTQTQIGSVIQRFQPFALVRPQSLVTLSHQSLSHKGGSS